MAQSRVHATKNLIDHQIMIIRLSHCHDLACGNSLKKGISTVSCGGAGNHMTELDIQEAIYCALYAHLTALLLHLHWLFFLLLFLLFLMLFNAEVMKLDVHPHFQLGFLVRVFTILLTGVTVIV